MWSIIVALISSVIGAFALQKARYDQNHSGAYSIGGYIAFIISFAMLEYALIFMNLAFVFAVWGAGNALLVTLIGRFAYQDDFPISKIVSLVLILVGLVGVSLT